MDTTAGVGVLVDYERSADLPYCVRLWSKGYSGSGAASSAGNSADNGADNGGGGGGGSVGDPGLARLRREDILEVLTTDAQLSQAVDGVPMAGLGQATSNPNPSANANPNADANPTLPDIMNFGCSLETARALPTVELLLGSIPSDVSLQQSALQLITTLMVGLDRVNASAQGEGLTIKYTTTADQKEEVFDTTSILCLAAVKDFVRDIAVLLEQGEEKIMSHVAGQSLAPEKITALYDHWKKVRATIEAVAADLTSVFAEDAERGDGEAAAAAAASTLAAAGDINNNNINLPIL